LHFIPHKTWLIRKFHSIFEFHSISRQRITLLQLLLRARIVLSMCGRNLCSNWSANDFICTKSNCRQPLSTSSNWYDGAGRRALYTLFICISHNNTADEKMSSFPRSQRMAAECTLPHLPNHHLILVQNTKGDRRDLLSSPAFKDGRCRSDHCLHRRIGQNTIEIQSTSHANTLGYDSNNSWATRGIPNDASDCCCLESHSNPLQCPDKSAYIFSWRESSVLDFQVPKEAQIKGLSHIWTLNENVIQNHLMLHRPVISLIAELRTITIKLDKSWGIRTE
jgi:hypothetical protein